MHYHAHVTDKIFWIGTNDRKTERFENYLPLPQGVAYNSYLINDEKTCIIDTVEFATAGLFIEKINGILGGKPLDYVIVNHMEPDHSGALTDIMEYFPEAKIIGNAVTLKMIKAFIPNFDESRFQTIKEGDKLELGHHTLTFAMVPMVHWPESMVTYDLTEKVLFSNDAFGSFGTLDGGIFDDEVNFSFYEDEMRRYYSNIVGKFGTQVLNAINKLSSLEIKAICPSHGIIWRKDVSKVINHFANWASFTPEEEGVVIMYGTLYGTTAKMANVIARELAWNGIKNIKIYDVSKTDASYIISDIWKYKGLIIGSASHNNDIYPVMQGILHKLQNYGLKNRYLGIFGNMLWSGGGVRAIENFAKSLPELEVVYESVEAKGEPTKEDQNRLENIARAMAEKLKSER